MKKIIFYTILTLFLIPNSLFGQENATLSTNLLDDKEIQIQVGDAVNEMYNFKFERAESEFLKLQKKYPKHPLSYFLLGLSNWWKMMPNYNNTQYDEQMMNYFDKSIYLAEKIHEQNPQNAESLFFLAAGHGMKARLYSFREKYRKASNQARKFLKYFNKSKEYQQLSPEFMFGDGIFNFYSVWLKENYPLTKAVLAFMPRGDKALGLQQLKQTAYNAFYTRTEAQFFLMEIYLSQEPDRDAAYSLAYYLHSTFPDNSYFHRSYVEVLFLKGMFKEVETESKKILESIEQGKTGYGQMTGRYVTYFLGYTYFHRYHNLKLAEESFKQCITYSEAVNAYKYGYYHGSLVYMARIADKGGNTTLAKLYYSKLLEHIDKDSQFYKEAKEYLKKNRKF